MTPIKGQNQRPVLLDAFGIIDFFALMELILEKQISGYRVVRILRLFRLCSQVKVLNEVFTAVVRSVLPTLILLLFSAFVAMTFALIAMEFFRGQIALCNDGTVSGKEECIGDFWHCPGEPIDDVLSYSTEAIGFDADCDTGIPIATPRVWGLPGKHGIPMFGFESLKMATRSMILGTSLEGFPTMMRSTMAANGVDKQPVEGSSRWAALFWIVGLWVAPWGLAQVIVGVVSDSFSHYYSNSIGHLTNRQQIWYLARDRAASIHMHAIVPVPENWFRKQCYILTVPETMCLRESIPSSGITTVCRKFYSDFFFLLAIIHAGLLASSSYDSHDIWESRLQAADFVFGILYSIDMIIRIAGNGKYVFFFTDKAKSWKMIRKRAVFDSVVALGLILSPILDTTIPKGRLLTSQRVTRILALVRLATRHPGIVSIVTTFASRIKSLLSVLALTMLVFSIFAVWGIEMFRNVKSGPAVNVNTPNFQTFGGAFLVVFTTVTGEEWYLPALDLMIQPPFCVPDNGEDPGDCGDYFAYTYFSLIRGFGGYLCLNAFLAVVIESFSNARNMPELNFNAVRTQWALFRLKSFGLNTSSDVNIDVEAGDRRNNRERSVQSESEDKPKTEIPLNKDTTHKNLWTNTKNLYSKKRKQAKDLEWQLKHISIEDIPALLCCLPPQDLSDNRQIDYATNLGYPIVNQQGKRFE